MDALELNIRLNDLCMLLLQRKMEENGEIKLMPKEIRRDVHNWAKKAGVPEYLMARLTKRVLTTAFEKTIAELDKMIEETDKVEGASASP